MSARPARINPDTLPVLVVASSLTGILAAVAFLLSFTGLSATAAWASIPSALAWTVPVTIDGAILVYTLAVLVKRRRGEAAPVQWTSLVLFTTASVAANAFHAFISAPEGVAIPGAIVAGLAPVAQLAATHTLADLIVEPVPAPADTVELVAVPKVVAVASNAASADRGPVSRPVRAPRVDEATRALVIELAASGDKSIRAIAAEVGIGKTTVGRLLSAESVALISKEPV